LREVWVGLRLQLSLLRRNPGHLLIFVTVPFFAAIFISGMDEIGKRSLIGYAVFGPAMIGLWAVSLDLGGSIIDSERVQQTFELQVIAPGKFSLVLLGRVLAITVIGMFTFPESILFARSAFGVSLHVEQPAVMAQTLAVTAVAMAGTSTAMATLFVAARAARRFANVLGYPFYIIGGLVVPITLLPAWVRPLSQLTYLYWSGGLLRASLSSQPIAHLEWRLGAVLGLGLATYLVGLQLCTQVINLLRREGVIGLS
jgi:ABC-2 type transport system permease protein